MDFSFLYLSQHLIGRGLCGAVQLPGHKDASDAKAMPGTGWRVYRGLAFPPPQVLFFSVNILVSFLLVLYTSGSLRDNFVL